MKVSQQHQYSSHTHNTTLRALDRISYRPLYTRAQSCNFREFDAWIQQAFIKSSKLLRASPILNLSKFARVESGQSQIEMSNSDDLTKSNFLTAISRCKNLHSFFNMAVESLVPDDCHRVPVFSMCLYNLCQTTFWLPHCN